MVFAIQNAGERQGITNSGNGVYRGKNVKEHGTPRNASTSACLKPSKGLRGGQKWSLGTRVGVIWQRGCVSHKGMAIYLEGNRETFHDFEPPKNGMFSYFKSILVFMWRRTGECSYWKQVFFFNKIILFGLDMNCTILSYVGKFLWRRVCCCDVSVTLMCLTLLRLHGLYSAPGSSVHGISQARILEWVATFSSPGHLPHPRIKPVSPALQVDSLLLSQIQIGLLWF